MKNVLELFKNNIPILLLFIVFVFRECSIRKEFKRQDKARDVQHALILTNALANKQDSIELLRLQNNALGLQRSVQRLSILETKQNAIEAEIQTNERILRRLFNNINTSNYIDSTYQSLKDRLK